MRACPAAGLLVVLSALVFCPRGAFAFSPYTHNWSANIAYADAVDDGMLTINGLTYALRPEVVEALRNWPQFYNAGVVGPDGFPDVTYGQAAIHPEKTGLWFKHILSEAWAAQSDASYNADEKGQILAFAHGFATHGAGDMWAHTIVNEFSKGVFPPIPEVLAAIPNAETAIRHLILDLVFGDATPGFDGNPERGPAPGGDVSDTSTPEMPYDAPHRFIFRTLVDPAAATPTPKRGPILDRFIELRALLAAAVSSDPDPIEDAINAFIDTEMQLMDVEEDCDFENLGDIVNCPIALAELGFDIAIDSAEAFHDFVTGTLAALADAIFDSYLAAWIDDIDEGFENWSRLGLATTRAFYDPQTRRNFQNEKCNLEGDELSLNRANCEDDVGLLDLVFDQADPFINAHLLSMLGAPDFVGGLRELLQDFSDLLGDILGPLGIPFNPIEEALAEIKEFAKDIVKDFIKEHFGIDFDEAKDFITHPTHWLNVESVTVSLGPFGSVTLNLFQPCDDDRLAEIMGLRPDRYVPSDFPFPGVSTRLRDDAEFNPDDFAPIKNTITTAKLLLLDGTALNRLLTDIRGRTISTYDASSNYMVDGLAVDTTWLRSIDGDHAWRADGRPTFCNAGEQGCPDVRDDDCHPDTLARDAALNAGLGVHPIWESCVLRPAFRILFTDWENGDESFPDNGDVVSSDPDNDPEPPKSDVVPTGAFYDDGVRQFVGGDNVFTLIASDGPPGRAFDDSELGVQYRIYTDPANRGGFSDAFPGDMFSITGADGRYFIDFRSEDPCHTFADETEGDPDDPLPPEATHTVEYWLDTTPPAVTCNTPPFGLVFDTDDFSNVDYAVDDGATGSGVAGFSSTVDGFLALLRIVPIATGELLDMYNYYPGTRTVAVTATDNIGNSGTAGCTFEIHATPESLISNLDRAAAEGLIKQPGTIRSLRTKLDSVKKKHDAGQHNTEGNLLEDFIHELSAQRGKWVDAITADRFKAYGQDRIDTHVLPLIGARSATLIPGGGSAKDGFGR